jgi:hypothetical protein
MTYNPFCSGVLFAICLFIAGAALYQFARTRKSRFATAVVRIALGLGACGVAVNAAELLVYAFFSGSSATGVSLSSRRWFEKYWRPINSFGYRDIEHAPSDLDAKSVLCVLGDSMVAGHGIADAEDRFSNILQRKLGNDWIVANVAKCGWGTSREHVALRAYPRTPDAVILSYFMNDIENAAKLHGFPQPSLTLPTPPRLRPWIQRSYLLDQAYARWYAFAHPESTPYRVYMDYLYACFDKPEIWNHHKDELEAMASLCERERIKLIVLVIPDLRDVERSRSVTSRVAGVFESLGVTVVDLTDSLAGREPASLVVNAIDAHANEALNREIADMLFEAIPRGNVRVADAAE